ncbi:Uncharacterised protein [Providencia rustigianii]|nr:Uncharacterised protein [Providencia rustigianii]
MSNIAPEKAYSSAVQIMNKVMKEKRSLSDIENARIMRFFDSMYRTHDYGSEYYALSACYYGMVSDIDNLLFYSEKVMSDLQNGKIDVGSSVENVLIALGNSLMVREVYHYMKGYNFPLSTMSEAVIELFMNTSIYMRDVDRFETMKCEFGDKVNNINKMDELNSFFLRNSNNSSELSSYVCDAFNIVSRDISKVARNTYKLPPLTEYDFDICNDDGYEFVSISFLFPAGSGIDIVLDLEELFLSSINGLDYKAGVKTKISFDFAIDGE